jgi:hypothetical protein
VIGCLLEVEEAEGGVMVVKLCPRTTDSCKRMEERRARLLSRYIFDDRVNNI